MQKYRAVFISDTHLGFKSANSIQLLKFLKGIECDKLYIVGDFIDIWSLSKHMHWPQDHNDILQRLLAMGKKGTQIIFLPGNHDEFFRRFGEISFGSIVLCDSIVHETKTGKKYLVIHGDQFDIVIRKAKWLSHLGSSAYDFSIWVNTFINKIRNFLGLKYWSLSGWLKYKVKSAVSFIGHYERNLSRFAKSKGADGVICGHIHYANHKCFDGIDYYNTGDWVESCTALVEHIDGQFEILHWEH